MRIRLGLVAVALLLLPSLLPTVAASAAPDRRATLSSANPRFTWESSGSGVQDPTAAMGPAPALRCTEAPYKCDYILLEVQDAGELSLTLEASSVVAHSDPTNFVCLGARCGPLQDIDGFVYKSTAAGHPVGKTLTHDCVTVNKTEACKVAVVPGFYVIEVEYYSAVAADYLGTAELIPAPPAPLPAQPQTLTLENCKFTLYYFRDSAERLRERVPTAYNLRPYPGSQFVSGGSATIAAAAYACDRVDIPGSTPAPAIFTVLSVLVYPESGTAEGPANSDFYVLWVHADNPHLVDLLASRGMPASLVPEMRFERPALSVGVRVDIPWSSGPYELGVTGYHQDVFHPHDNTFLHVALDGRVVRLDFVTRKARDHFCFQASDAHDVPCGSVQADAGSPVAGFFGDSHRHAHNTWDHDPLERSFFVLH